MPLRYVMVVVCELLMLEYVRKSRGSVSSSSPESSAAVCTPPWFQCGNSSVCVHQRSFCDGSLDCPGGEDEDNSTTCAPRSCVLGDYLDYQSRLIKAQAEAICDGLPLPAGCSCNEGHKAECVNLTAMPASLPDHVTFWYLMYDPLAALHSFTVSSASLISIKITGLPIRWLSNDTFSQTQRVTQILIQDTMIQGWHPDTFSHLRDLRFIALKNNKITLEARDLHMPNTVHWIYLNNNSISLLRNTTFGALDPYFISVSNNRIRYIEPGTFSRMSHLKELYMRGNLIKSLQESVFHDNALCILDISHNPISRLPEKLLSRSQELDTLKMEGMVVTNLGPAHFSDLSHLKQVFFSSFKYCSFAPLVEICKPNGDGVSTVDDLLDNPFVRWYIWFIAVLVCIGNIAVLLARQSLPQPTSPHGLSISNLCVADILMGVYLLIIAVQDSRFRGHYIDHALQWTSSLGCQVAGFIALLSSEVSLFTLTMLSVERCYIISHHFRQSKPLARCYAVLLMIAIWMCGIMLAGLPILVLDSPTAFYGANSICLPLHIHDPFMEGWLYSAVLFCGINLAAMLVMTIAYGIMYWSIQHTRRATGVALAELACTEERLMALRLLLLVLTNVCCLVPVITVKIAALAGRNITDEAYAWLAVVAVPINSAVNPLLYSLTSRSFCHQLRSSILQRRRSSQESLRDTLIRWLSTPHHSWPSLQSREMPALPNTQTFNIPAAGEVNSPPQHLESTFSFAPPLQFDATVQDNTLNQPCKPHLDTEDAT